MKVPTFEEEAAEFLNVMTVNHRFGGRLKIFPSLQRLYAMRAAYWIRKNTSLLMPTEEKASNTVDLNSPMNQPYEVLYEAYRRLLAAYRAVDRVAINSALQEMGVPDFCPILKGHLQMMENLAEQEEMSARLVLHLELGLFALEFDDEAAARRHAQKAWTLSPEGWERYVLCTLQGAFEALDGNVNEAVHWLGESISACFEDEAILIACGLRPPNLSLAQKLLVLGERTPVIDYLSACGDVWTAKAMPFLEWLYQIESGQTPDLEKSELITELNRPFHRLDLQSQRIYSPRAPRAPSAKKSREQVLREREKRLAKARRFYEEFNQ